jgi:hypothetical protein
MYIIAHREQNKYHEHHEYHEYHENIVSQFNAIAEMMGTDDTRYPG